MVSIISKIVGALTGTLGSKIVDGVTRFFPPSMSDKEKGDLKVKIMEISNIQELELLKVAEQSQSEFNDRIKSMEGTADEIKGIPIIGPMIITVRAMVRPMITAFMVVLDYQTFSGAWPWNPEFKNVFFALNLLVLGFWFGERALKNVMPLFTKFMEAKR